MIFSQCLTRVHLHIRFQVGHSAEIKTLKDPLSFNIKIQHRVVINSYFVIVINVFVSMVAYGVFISVIIAKDVDFLITT